MNKSVCPWIHHDIPVGEDGWSVVGHEPLVGVWPKLRDERTPTGAYRVVSTRSPGAAGMRMDHGPDFPRFKLQMVCSVVPIDDLDSYRLAKTLVDRHGDGATADATTRAEC